MRPGLILAFVFVFAFLALMMGLGFMFGKHPNPALDGFLHILVPLDSLLLIAITGWQLWRVARRPK